MNRDTLLNVRWGLPNETFWRPPTDVYETDDSAVVTIEIAGLSPGDYQITLTGRLLVVAGERRDPAAKLAYQRMEIRYGKFHTEIPLPWALDLSMPDATYQGGFLRIVLRKAQAHRVPVKPVDSTAASQ